MLPLIPIYCTTPWLQIQRLHSKAGRNPSLSTEITQKNILMDDPTNHDSSPQKLADDTASVSSAEEKLRAEIKILRAERDRVSEALLWATHQLGLVLDSPPMRSTPYVQPKRRARQLIDEGRE